MNQQEFVAWIQNQGFNDKFYAFVAENVLSFENYSSYTEAQWKEFLGGPVGAVIYNYLHPANSSQSNREPHPKRKERWDKLNDVLQYNAKKRKRDNSTAYSYVSWMDIKDIFSTEVYIQPTNEIAEDHINSLLRYLTFSSKCFDSMLGGKESQRLHVIAPIIIFVCVLFDGDVKIEVEQDLNGEYINAHVHFEFVLRRGNKRICIVEAKKDDIDQGVAQDLLGCEVAAELDPQDKVYGIVTNYFRWSFLRSLDEKIELDECSMTMVGGVPTLDSLKLIAGKIYAMLSDE